MMGRKGETKHIKVIDLIILGGRKQYQEKDLVHNFQELYYIIGNIKVA